MSDIGEGGSSRENRSLGNLHTQIQRVVFEKHVHSSRLPSQFYSDPQTEQIL